MVNSFADLVALRKASVAKNGRLQC